MNDAEDETMTIQYDHASKIADKLRDLGVQADVKGGEEDFMLSVVAETRSFFIPPYSAYNHDAATTAQSIFEAL